MVCNLIILPYITPRNFNEVGPLFCRPARPIDPFFSANIGLIKNLRPSWCCYYKDLSRDISFEKIKTTFRTVLRGQRSKKVILAKFILFCVIFVFLAKIYALEQVYSIAVSNLFHIILIWRNLKWFMGWFTEVKGQKKVIFS